MEREGLAVLWDCKHFHHHKLLLNMSRKAEPPAQIQKWMMELQAYTYELEHIPWKEMAADYRSRYPITVILHELRKPTRYRT